MMWCITQITSGLQAYLTQRAWLTTLKWMPGTACEAPHQQMETDMANIRHA